MLPEERRLRIIDGLQASSSLRTEQLASSLGVSIETIRRDFRALEKKGLLRRVHGGAVSLDGHQMEAPYPDRALEQNEEKSEIATAVVDLFPSGGTVFLDLGTTVAAVVTALPRDYQGTIVTTSVYVAMLLAHHDHLTVLVAGGRMRRGDLSLSGGATLRFLDGVYPDMAIISTGAVDPRAGITDYNPDELETKRVMLRNAKRSLAVADSTKFGRVAPFQICPIDEPDLIVTDSGLTNDQRMATAAAGGKLLVP
ncbi:DeoR/GlpR family DNA-binding transcription regulator [Enemella sp. A6]|uniref:DeoR/GlpR family DNA-binding transcription regulator n=1 Tax=Enemella sp. A6 TaxID=3440152 RepID=UPI003EB88E5D